jgi:TonB family protein
MTDKTKNTDHLSPAGWTRSPLNRIQVLTALWSIGLLILGPMCSRSMTRYNNVIVPTPLTEVIPPYPEELRQNGIEGRVVVGILIRKDGTVSRVRVKETSGNPMLDAAAVQAAQQCTFTPPLDGRGKAISLWVERPFSFKLGFVYDDSNPAPLQAEYLRAAVMPVLVTDVKPAYPDSAIVLGQEGRVTMYLWLRTNGTVSLARIEAGSGSAWLDSAAVRAARQCVYSPAKDGDGRSINIWVPRTNRFTLPTGGQL